MSFASPIWLYVAIFLVMLTIVVGWLGSRKRRAAFQRFAAERLAPSLLQNVNKGRRTLRLVLVAVGVALIGLALARPQFGYRLEERPVTGIDVLFALDVSRSMLAEDIVPNRLQRAKFAVLDYVDQYGGDRVGLIAFAGNAFLQVPLTADYNAFRQSVETLSPDVVGRQGTDIAKAIREASAAFGEDDSQKLLVMITDGEDLEESGVKAARKAADAGVKIYAVGVGSPQGAPIPTRDQFGRVSLLRDSSGQIVTTKLDEETLRRIAEATGGAYFPLEANAMDAIHRNYLATRPTQTREDLVKRVGVERFQIPLLLAVLLLAGEMFVSERRRVSASASIVAAGILLFVMVSPSAEAVSPGQLFRIGQYEAAAKAYDEQISENPEDARLFYNRGLAQYRAEQPEAALESFQRALATLDLSLQADALYNSGNIFYGFGADALAEVTDIPSLIASAESTENRAFATIQAGLGILQRAGVDLGALDLPTGNISLGGVAEPSQEEIQRALMQAEQSLTGVEESEEALRGARLAQETALPQFKQSVQQFQAALDLLPGAEDAQYNLDLARERVRELEETLPRVREHIEVHKKANKDLKLVIEELRKLLDSPPQDQQQDSSEQSQDSQQQQQQQQSQSQDQQNQQRQEDQQQEPSGQQEDQQQEQGEQGQSQNQQSGEQADDSPRSESEESAEEPDAAEEEARGADEDEPSQASEAEDERAASEEDGSESARPEEGKDEAQGENEAEEGDDRPRDEAIAAQDQVGSEEEPGEEDREELLVPGEETDEEGSEEEAVSAGGEEAAPQEAADAEDGRQVYLRRRPMTEEEAANALEALRRKTRNLPVTGSDRNSNDKAW